MLLSLENIYAPAFQLALDMLKRLATANEEILDVLVSKDQLLVALRFLRGLGPEAVATVSPRRFLEAAYNTKDASLFYIGASQLTNPRIPPTRPCRWRCAGILAHPYPPGVLRPLPSSWDSVQVLRAAEHNAEETTRVPEGGGL